MRILMVMVKMGNTEISTVPEYRQRTHSGTHRYDHEQLERIRLWLATNATLPPFTMP